MRILKIRFKNLNSLVGEWEIDLTHPAFVSEGIFAITGPTGAGKTTLLDAICLALYGRTPRLSRVTKSGNEIMSRQTGECFAEVVFETQAGRFRCHWSQHRSRKKPNGELQPPKQEIADADSGLVYEAKMRGVAEQIELVTGMDFDRFTRSMLLAQGGFATFLQAAPDERSPILEQITGTEIYSHISIGVHKRRADEKIKLDLLQAECSGMNLLSDADEQHLINNLEQKKQQELEIHQQLTHQHQAIAWLGEIFRLEQELRDIDRQQLDLNQRQHVFKPELVALQRANQALELTGDYVGLLSLRRAQETELHQHAESVELLPAQHARVKQVDDELACAIDALNRKKNEQKEALGVIRIVRELDLKYREKVTPFNVVRDEAVQRERTLVSMRLTHANKLGVFHQKSGDFDEMMKQLNETGVDERLIEHFAEIRTGFHALEQLNERYTGVLHELTVAEAQHAELTRVSMEQSARLMLLKEELSSIQAHLTEKKALVIQDITILRQSVLELNQRKDDFNRLKELLTVSNDAMMALNEQSIQHDRLAAEQLTLVEQLHVQQEKYHFLERETQLLETQLSLLQKIQRFEDVRQQLIDGESCPVCGAKEHPFTDGSTPAPNETAMRLQQTRVELKQTAVCVSDLKVKQAETQKDLDQIKALTTQRTEQFSLVNEQINQVLPNLVGMKRVDFSHEILQSLQQDNLSQLLTLSNTISAVENIEKEIATLRDAFDTAKEAVANAELDTQTAAHHKEMAVQTVVRVKKMAAALLTEREQAMSDLLHELLPFGINQLTAEVLVDLTRRRSQRLLRQQKKTELEQEILSLEREIAYQHQQISVYEGELEKQQGLFHSMEIDLNHLSQQRQALYNNKNPDDEEIRFVEEIDAAEKRLDTARAKQAQTHQEEVRITHRIEALERSLELRRQPLAIDETNFQTRLIQNGFVDEASFCSASLSEDERKKRMHQASQLNSEQTELESKWREKTALLDAEQRKKLTVQALEEHQSELPRLLQLHRDVQHDMGAIRQRLKDNDGLRQILQERVSLIERQKKECSRWTMLHDLIGSVDGKKYRNFAQGLTFEMMISHANRQLLKMTDRYLLSRDESQPLELNVIDNYQAGEIRSTKNLSGGESFLVSLCLALGLSQMSSQNVRVDSLFLDEGFGTLDDDALDTALETLAALQHEGKLIGMISHVPALKERISTQIRVTPKTGGRSVISGLGCRCVENPDI